MNYSQDELEFQLAFERKLNELLIKTLSHDLANPLAVIRSYASLIRDKRIPEESFPELWSKIEQSHETIFKLLAQIRQSSKARQALTTTTIGTASPARSLGEALRLFEERFLEKAAILTMRGYIPEKVYVTADEEALKEHVFMAIFEELLERSTARTRLFIDITHSDEDLEIKISSPDVQLKGPSSSLRLLVSSTYLQLFDGSLEILEWENEVTMAMKLKKVRPLEVLLPHLDMSLAPLN